MYELSKEFYPSLVLDYPAEQKTSTRLGGKIWYARCSDKFIVGVSGSYQYTCIIRKLIEEFLDKRLNINLNPDNIDLTHLINDYAVFLGYSISIPLSQSSLPGPELSSSSSTLISDCLAGGYESKKGQIIRAKLRLIIPKKLVKL